MANKIRGITVEIGADTSKLTEGLSKVNGELSGTQKQLKDVEKLLKLDPKNTELLAQKQKLLGDAVKQSKTKLDELKKAEASMKDSGVDENSAQFMALKREIVATQSELEGYAREAQKASESVGGISEQTISAEEATARLSAAMGKVSKAAGTVVKGLANMALGSIQASDELNTMAKQTGLTTAELQKFQYASELVDVSTESIAKALQKMKKNMATTSKDTAAAWQKIGVSTVKADGSMRDATEVFYETLKALSAVENETERDTIAMQLFGKGADELAGIIDDGGQSLFELGEKAEELGLILSQETLDGLNKTNDSIDTLKATISAAVAQAGAELGQTLGPVIEGVIELLTGFVTTLANIPSGVLIAVGVLAGLTAAIAGVINAILGISAAVKAITELKAAFAVLNTTILANPTTWIIAGIVAAVAALGVAVYEIVKHWDTVKEWLSNVWGGIKDGFNAVVDWAKGVKDKMVDIFASIGDKIVAIFDKVKTAFKAVKDFFVDVFKSIANFFIKGINGLINGLNKFSIDIPDWIPAIGGKKFGFNIPTIPLLAQGGEVLSGSAIVGEAGPELLTVANGRTIVQPLTTNNNTYSTPVNINVYGAQGQNVNELAAAVSRRLEVVFRQKEAAY